MTHRIELTEEQKSDLIVYIQGKGSITDLTEKWLNANLPNILKTEPLVVTDKMAAKYHEDWCLDEGGIIPSHKAALQAFADRYLTPQPTEAEAAPTSEADALRKELTEARAKVAELDFNNKALFNSLSVLTAELGVEDPPGALLAIQALKSTLTRKA